MRKAMTYIIITFGLFVSDVCASAGHTYCSVESMDVDDGQDELATLRLFDPTIGDIHALFDALEADGDMIESLEQKQVRVLREIYPEIEKKCWARSNEFMEYIYCHNKDVFKNAIHVYNFLMSKLRADNPDLFKSYRNVGRRLKKVSSAVMKERSEVAFYYSQGILAQFNEKGDIIAALESVNLVRAYQDNVDLLPIYFYQFIDLIIISLLECNIYLTRSQIFETQRVFMAERVA